jgi:hypothetical protein
MILLGKIAAALVGMSITFFIYWYSGLDLMQRGGEQAVALASSLVVGSLIFLRYDKKPQGGK